MDSMAREKYKDFLGKVQNGRDAIGSYSFFMLLYGLLILLLKESSSIVFSLVDS